MTAWHRACTGTLVCWSLASFTFSPSTMAQVPGTAAPGTQGERGQGRGGRGIQTQYPVLPIGSPLPEFSLLGIDGKRHTPKEYAGAKIMAVMFESNHCPASIAYEKRVHELYDEFRGKGVQVIAINPNNPKAVRLNELGYTDMSDSFEEMKLRAAFMSLPWPYLYDGETQALSMKMGAVATPHIFIFDQDRRLRYQGAIDDSRAVAQVKERHAANAINALLAGRPVPVAETRALGCSTKWLNTSMAGVEEEMKDIQSTEVTLSPIDRAGLQALRENATSQKTIVVSFWQAGNRLDRDQFGELQTTYRMYARSRRPMDMVTIATDGAEKSAAVLEFLKGQHATTRNTQLAPGTTAPPEMFGTKWNAAQPLTLVIAPDGKVLYQREGRIDIYEVRRVILASFPDEPSWPGIKEYYRDAVARTVAKAK
ncbi:MAG: thioredoxin family protein [Vicinamibacterales bacterium]